MDYGIDEESNRKMIVVIAESYEIAVKTLSTLKIVLDKLQTDVPAEYMLELRDSAIQRFKYSIDTFWKFLKIYMQDYLKMSVESAAPRAIIKDALTADLLSREEFEKLMQAITNRNETSHAYNESIAQDVLQELPALYDVMHSILIRIDIKN